MKSIWVAAIASVLVAGALHAQGASLSVGDSVVFSGGPGQPPREIQTGTTVEFGSIRSAPGNDPALTKSKKPKGEVGAGASGSVGTVSADGTSDVPVPEAPVKLDVASMTTDDLAQKATDTSAGMRMAALAALAARTDAQDRATVTSTLEYGLGDPEPRVVQAALQALGELGDPAAGPEVLKSVYDGNDGTAIAAIDALSAMRYTAAIPELNKLGDRDSGKVGQAAKRAVAALSSPPGTRPEKKLAKHR